MRFLVLFSFLLTISFASAPHTDEFDEMSASRQQHSHYYIRVFNLPPDTAMRVALNVSEERDRLVPTSFTIEIQQPTGPIAKVCFLTTNLQMAVLSDESLGSDPSGIRVSYQLMVSSQEPRIEIPGEHLLFEGLCPDSTLTLSEVVETRSLPSLRGRLETIPEHPIPECEPSKPVCSPAVIDINTPAWQEFFASLSHT